MSEKRDIFTHHPQGYESGFPEKEAKEDDSKGRRGRKTCHDRKENGCQMCFLKGRKKKKPEVRKERWKYDTVEGREMKREEDVVTRGSGNWIWRKGGKDGKEQVEDMKKQETEKENRRGKMWPTERYECLSQGGLQGLFEGH